MCLLSIRFSFNGGKVLEGDREEDQSIAHP